ncbi:MAG: BACON domain-containing protein [Bacteroidales bacterium]|nr:BACON domain-containing protein [Bacteroidales bacterium]
MKNNTFIRIFSAMLCLLAVAACGGKGSGPEPSDSKATQLSVSSGSTLNADVTSYDLTVTCDGSWSAAVSDGGSWASVSTDKTDKGGTIHVNMNINETDDVRTAVITVTAGSLTKQARITQKALSSIIDKKSLQFDGPGEKTLTLTTQSAWTAQVSGAPWLTVSPSSGQAGTTKITVKVTEEYREIGSRNAVIQFAIAGKTLNVNVLQGQTNFLEADADRFYKFDQPAQTLELKTRTNVDRPNWRVDFKVGANQGAEAPGLWIKLVSSKAVKENTFTFSISENDRTYTREADIIFFIGDVSDTVTVSQKGVDPLIRTAAIGAYDVQDETWLYRAGNDMLSRLYAADGKTMSMRIINAADVTVISVTGVPVAPAVGDEVTVGFSYFQSGKTLVDTSYPVKVLKVGTEGEEAGLVWLRQEDGAGFIIKK